MSSEYQKWQPGTGEAGALRARGNDFTRRVLDNLFAFVGVLTLDGTLLDANRAPLEAAGLSSEDVVGKKFWDCYWWSYSPEVQDWLREAVRRAAGGETLRTDVQVRMAGDTRMWLEFQLAPLRDEHGRITHLIPSAMDVTDRKEVEAAHTESEARFRALADNIPQLAWMADEAGWIWWYNRRWYEYTGTSFEEMQGWGWQQVHHPEHVERVTQKFRHHLATGEAWEDTFPLRSREGEYRWFLSRAIPIRDERGRVARWFGTNTDITAQREVEEALRDAGRRKDEFLAMLAHELRNPLVPVMNAVAILEAKGPAEPVLERQRQIIKRQVEHMARLVSDLLEVSRISQGKLTLQPHTVDLVEVLRSCVGDYRPSVERAGLALESDLPGEPLLLRGDAVRLCQAVSNLLSNAIKFTPRGGRIRVDLHRLGPGSGARETARVVVRDTGPGLPEELLPRLWEPFSQGEQELDRTLGGLGLGLALVKGVVEGHGGTVRAGNAAAGGAEFLIDLPLLTHPTELNSLVSVVGDRWSPTGAPVALRHSFPGAELPAGTAAPAFGSGDLTSENRGPGTRRSRVLLIEDNRDAAETMQDLLEMEGFEVRLALNGHAGLEAAREWEPDLVLSDIGLPGLNGLEVAARLRQDPATQHLRLIAISGYAQPEDISRGRAAGFDDYLVKPVEPAALLRLATARSPR